MFGLFIMLQPKDTSGDEGGETLSPFQIAEQMCNDILDEVLDVSTFRKRGMN